jgi:hypothetical protein
MRTTRLFSYRYILTALLLAMSAGVLFAAYQLFQEEARRPLDESKQVASTDQALTRKDLDATVAQQPLQPARYSLIADKNLFSPKREPWAPPPSPPPPEPEKKPDAPEPEPKADVKTVDNRKDVLLYGVATVDGRQRAILRFLQYQRNNQTRIVTPGERVSDAEGSRAPDFLVEKLTQGGALIRDLDADVRFVVNLHDKSNQAATARQVQAAPAPQQANVQIQSAAPGGKSGTTSTVATGTARTTGTGGGGGGGGKAAGSGPQGEYTMADIRKMAPAERERLATEGKLRRINTMAGYAYRPVSKSE